MGCGISRTAPSPGNVPKEVVRTAPESGEVFKNHSVVFKVMPSEEEARDKFEQDGTLLKNSDSGHLALRQMLDEPLSQNALGKFAAKIQVLDIFMCWVDIQEYKLIPTDSYRRSKALHIYHKYIKDDAALMIGVTSPAERQHFWTQLQNFRDLPALLTAQFYDSVQSRCFMQMYHHIYLPFKETQEFKDLTNLIKNKYNRVKLSDFEYYNKLGEGGFGFVLHCKKKSTGKHYAMKIQTKLGLLECYHDEPSKVLLEKDAFASLQHPFIVNLYYAFQTPSLAIMVLDLADCGDLHTCLANSPHNRLPEDRVRFYMAEIILALAYLHQRGLIYRDLKPQNVLLNADGHVQLVDLGGVLDDDGAWTRRRRGDDSLLPLFSSGYVGKKLDEGVETEDDLSSHRAFVIPETNSMHAAFALLEAAGIPISINAPAPVITVSDKNPAESAVPTQESIPNAESVTTAEPLAASATSEVASVPASNAPVATATTDPEKKKRTNKRKQSIMGTLGYMAPEMVLMLSGQYAGMGEHRGPRVATRKLIRRGYTNAVDWWSLGVTAYKLLTGVRPFADKHMCQVVDMASTLHAAVGENSHFKEYAMLFQKLNFPSYLSPMVRDFLSSLLDVDDTTRLGVGKDGANEVKRHPFFRGLDWEMLEQKQIEPPYTPPPPPESTFAEHNSNGSDLRTVLNTYGKASLMDQIPLPQEQRHFDTWDFISAHTLRVESGLSMMMEQLVTNPKARKIMGESEKTNASRPPEKSSKENIALLPIVKWKL
jgi:serine/threonine protein kinase